MMPSAAKWKTVQAHKECGLSELSVKRGMTSPEDKAALANLKRASPQAYSQVIIMNQKAEGHRDCAVARDPEQRVAAMQLTSNMLHSKTLTKRKGFLLLNKDMYIGWQKVHYGKKRKNRIK